MRKRLRSAPGLVVEHRLVGDSPVVAVAGEIDLATGEQFREAIDRALDQHGRVELDLRDTTFMDSTGLTALISAHHRLGRNRDAVVVHNPSRMVRRLLDISGVGELIDVRTEGTDGTDAPTASSAFAGEARADVRRPEGPSTRPNYSGNAST